MALNIGQKLLDGQVSYYHSHLPVKKSHEREAVSSGSSKAIRDVRAFHRTLNTVPILIILRKKNNFQIN
jgi:hypothetical protein